MKRLRADLIRCPRTLAVVCGLFAALTALPAHAQSCVPPPAGLIAWWAFDGSPNDISGNNRNPSSTSGISYVPATVGQGATFGGSSTQTPSAGWIDIPQGTLAPQKLTIAAWVKPQGPGPNKDGWGSAIVEKAIDSTHSSVFLSWDFSTSKFRFGGGHIQTFIASKGSFPPGTFYHVAGTYDGTTFELFVNKVSQGTFKASTPITYIPSIPWTIGTEPLPWRTGTYKRTWNGVIDEVEIFERALSQSEINLLYDAGSAGMCKPQAPVAKGMTWRWATATTNGTVYVGCGSTEPNPCNPSVGDRPCTDSLPLLCFKPSKFPVPKSVVNTDVYNRWSGGIVGTTPPVAPAAPPISSSLANANQRCADEFGEGWRVAEFHDGQYWGFQAYGNVGDPKSRFWVHINDQPKGTCWK